MSNELANRYWEAAARSNRPGKRKSQPIFHRAKSTHFSGGSCKTPPCQRHRARRCLTRIRGGRSARQQLQQPRPASSQASLAAPQRSPAPAAAPKATPAPARPRVASASSISTPVATPPPPHVSTESSLIDLGADSPVASRTAAAAVAAAATDPFASNGVRSDPFAEAKVSGGAARDEQRSPAARLRRAQPPLSRTPLRTGQALALRRRPPRTRCDALRP